MAKINAPLHSFNQGEVSKLALARADVAKLRLAAECQVNFMPWVLGPMMLRPGLLFVGEVAGDNPARLIPFVFSKSDTALIEATNNQFRVWLPGTSPGTEQLLTRVAVGTTIADPNFGGGGWTTANTTSGCTATIAGGVATLTATARGGLAQIQQTITVAGGDQGKEHGLRVVVTDGPVTIRIGSAAGLQDVMTQTAIDTGTHSLVFTPAVGTVYLQIESADTWSKTLTQCSIEPAGVVTVPTTWASSDLPNLRWDQSGDVIYVACYGQQQRMIQRRGTRPGARGWSFALYRSNNGPFNALPGANVTLTPSVQYGNGTLTASKPYFQLGHVGALFQLFSNGQSNQAVLGAADAYSTRVRISGLGATARNYGWNVAGTYVGTLTLQRSFDGPTSGFTDVATAGSGATGNPAQLVSSTGTVWGATAVTQYGSPPLDNVIAWERVGFKSGNYTSGNATVVTVDYVGHQIGVFNTGGGYGICRVTGYTSPTVVSIEVLQPFSSLNATANWVESIWSGVQGWPSSVAFHEGRLWWFGPLANAIGSQSNNYTGYASQDAFGNPLGEAGVIVEQLGSGDVDKIQWGLSLRGLLMGRERSIASARSQSFDDQPMTPTAFSVKDCSTNGAASLPAVKLDQKGIFVQQSGRRVYELFFNPQRFDYAARDLTRLNLDIGKAGFVDIAIQRQPDATVHLVRGDGQVAVLLNDEDDDVVAWTRLMTQGSVENVAVLPGSGIEDTVYYVVNRTVGGGITRRFIEKLALRDNCTGGAANQQADCATVYSDSPVFNVVTPLPNTQVVVWADGAFIGTQTTDFAGNCQMPDGLSHSNIVAGLGGSLVIGSTLPFLPNHTAPNQIFSAPQGTLNVGTQYNGQTAEVFADIGGTGEMKHIGPLTVSLGAITLPNNQVASTIVAVIGYAAAFLSAKLAYAAQLGAALTQRKKIGHLGLVLYDTHYQGVQYGQRFDALDPLPLVEAGQSTPSGTIWPQYDEPMIEVPGDWNTDARLALFAQAPTPCTVGGAVIGMTTMEK
jgi:hypothetical protein